jgi:beta-lactamase regulating signal transducer with metallopeptidase domain
MTGVVSMLAALLALAAVAEAVTRGFPRRPALAHALWLLVLARGLVPSIPLVPGPALGEPLAGVSLLMVPGEPLGAADESGRCGAPLGALLAIWAAGSAWHLVRSLRGYWALRRCLRLGRPAPPALCAEVARQARRLGLRPPRVCSLPSIRSPFLVGLRRPVLCWPEGDGPIPPQARAAVILHELAHLERRDLWTAWIAAAARCLWWWNPLVRYAAAQTRRLRELACDAWVVERLPKDRDAYARALLEAAAAPSAPSPAGPIETLGWIGPGSRFRERLSALYADRRPARTPAATGALAAVLFAASLPGLGAPDATGTRATEPEAIGVPAENEVPAHHDESPAGNDVPAAAPAATPATTGRREPTEAQRAALESFGVSGFEELEQLARAALARDPGDGRALYRLGWALFGQGDLTAAAAAFEEQYARAWTPSYASYNAACCYAQLGDADLAVTWLERSVASGYDDPLQIESDEDLASLRDDPRFQDLIEQLAAQSRP